MNFASSNWENGQHFVRVNESYGDVSSTLVGNVPDEGNAFVPVRVHYGSLLARNKRLKLR